MDYLCVWNYAYLILSYPYYILASVLKVISSHDDAYVTFMLIGVKGLNTLISKSSIPVTWHSKWASCFWSANTFLLLGCWECSRVRECSTAVSEEYSAGSFLNALYWVPELEALHQLNSTAIKSGYILKCTRTCVNKFQKGITKACNDSSKEMMNNHKVQDVIVSFS